MRSLLLAALAAALLATAPAHAAETSTSPKAAIGDWGVDTSGLSKTVEPGDDFHRHVNEAWLESAQIPAGLASIDTFTEVSLSTEQRVAAIIEEAREGDPAPGTPERRIADFHRSHSDRARRDAPGITPIASTLATAGSPSSCKPRFRRRRRRKRTKSAAPQSACDPGARRIRHLDEDDTDAGTSSHLAAASRRIWRYVP